MCLYVGESEKSLHHLQSHIHLLFPGLLYDPFQLYVVESQIVSLT